MNISEIERNNIAEDSEYVHEAWKSNISSVELGGKSRFNNNLPDPYKVNRQCDPSIHKENTSIDVRKRIIEAKPIEDHTILACSFSENDDQI